jgi:hypothetical protein
VSSARSPASMNLVERVLTPLGVFLVAFAILVATRNAVLEDPPYWDALLGAFPQAHWLAQHSFSPGRLLTEAQPYLAGGACVYPFSVQPWIIAALEGSGATLERRLLVLHLASFVCAAFAVAWTFRLARGGGFEPMLAALVAVALLAAPTFQAMACQINMDMPLVACTLGALVALREGRLRACCVWSALALLVKPTGAIVVAACLTSLASRLLRPGAFGPGAFGRGAFVPGGFGRGASDFGESARRALRSAAIVHVALLLVFLGELALTAHLGKSAPGVVPMAGFGPLFAKRLWTLPEYGAGLVVFLAAVPWIVRRAARGAGWELEIDLAVFLLVFVCFFGQYANVLPRYFLQSWPVLLVGLGAIALRAGLGQRAVGAAFALFALFGLANAHGRFHPTKLAEWSDPADPRPIVANDGWLLERSMEYRDGLALDRRLARRLAQREGALIVTHWPVLHMLLVPEFGYVERPLEVATTETPIDFGAPMVELGAAPPERRVWALTPNVFCGPLSRILPGDEVLETIEQGRLRAFLVRRPELR